LTSPRLAEPDPSEEAVLAALRCEVREAKRHADGRRRVIVAEVHVVDGRIVAAHVQPPRIDALAALSTRPAG
jgi:hypothetical protein